MRYVDVHTHLQFSAFKDDYREVIKRTLAGGMMLVNVGTQCDTSRRAVEVTHEFPEHVFATVGLHPAHTAESFHDERELDGGEAARAFTSRGEVFEPESYRALAEDPKTVAIGECGLDYYRIGEGGEREERIAKQKEAFVAQIKLAHEVKKPLMIHCRKASADLLKVIVSHSSSLVSPPGIIHFYTDGKEDAEKFLKMGFFFSFGGVITFARDYDAIIGMIPPEKILSETDAPYVAPAPHRGKRNEPLYVAETVKRLAAIKGISEEAMAEHIVLNAMRVFGLATI